MQTAGNWGRKASGWAKLCARNLLKFTTRELLPKSPGIFGNTGARHLIALSHCSLIRCNRSYQKWYLVGLIARLSNDRKYGLAFHFEHYANGLLISFDFNKILNRKQILLLCAICNKFGKSNIFILFLKFEEFYILYEKII